MGLGFQKIFPMNVLAHFGNLLSKEILSIVIFMSLTINVSDIFFIGVFTYTTIFKFSTGFWLIQIRFFIGIISDSFLMIFLIFSLISLHKRSIKFDIKSRQKWLRILVQNWDYWLVFFGKLWVNRFIIDFDFLSIITLGFFGFYNEKILFLGWSIFGVFCFWNHFFIILIID